MNDTYFDALSSILAECKISQHPDLMFADIAVLYQVWWYSMLAILLSTFVLIILLILFPPNTRCFSIVSRVLVFFDVSKEVIHVPSKTNPTQFKMRAKKDEMGGFISILIVLIFGIFSVHSLVQYLDPTRYQLYPSTTVLSDLDKKSKPELPVSVVMSLDRIPLEYCTNLTQFVKLHWNGKVINTTASMDYAYRDLVCLFSWEVDAYPILKKAATSTQNITIVLQQSSVGVLARASQVAVTSKVVYMNDRNGYAQNSMFWMPFFKQYLYSQKTACYDYTESETLIRVDFVAQMMGFVFQRDWIGQAFKETPYSKVVFFSNQETVTEQREGYESHYQIILHLSAGSTFSVVTAPIFTLLLQILGLLGGLIAGQRVVRSVLKLLLQWYKRYLIVRTFSVFACLAFSVLIGYTYMMYLIFNKTWGEPFSSSTSIILFTFPLALGLALLWNTCCCYQRHYDRNEEDGARSDETIVTATVEETVPFANVNE